MAVINRRLNKNMGNMQGSALVLTMLFILLLSTMSMGMYLYSRQQETYSSSNYKMVAADYIAFAGLDFGKRLLASRFEPNNLIDTLGNHNGWVDRDDFPFVQPGWTEVGTDSFHGANEGKGIYSTRIDEYHAENVEMKMKLSLDYNYILSNLDTSVGAPAGKINKIYGFSNCHVRLLRDGEVINEQDFNVHHNILTNYLQVPASTDYIWYFDNVLNPYAGNKFKFQLCKTPLDPNAVPNFYGEFDKFENLMYLYPNDLPFCDSISDCGSSILITNRAFASHGGADNPIILPDRRNPGSEPYYIVHVRDTNHQNIEVRFHYSLSGSPAVNTATVIPGGSWTPGETDRYAILDFNNMHANWVRPNIDSDPATYGVLGLHSSDLNQYKYIVEVYTTSGGIPQPFSFTISRGVNVPVSLSYRMRTEKMMDDCPGHNPSSPGCCWYPDWDGSSCTPSNNYAPLVTLGETDAFGESIDLESPLISLDREHTLTMDEFYTITATGNVDRASRTQQLTLAPLSFLDYARFVEHRLSIAEGATFTGKIYAQSRIELPNLPGATAPINFYDDVYTSSVFMDPKGLAVFHGDATYHTHYKFLELPDRRTVRAKMESLANNGGLVLPTTGTITDIFLGNYDYRYNNGQRYGFDFYDSNPIDNIDESVYRPPDANFRTEDYPYPIESYTPPGGSTINLAVGTQQFNGVVYVNGNVRVWGKLSGRSLTIVANGDIYINREILMGTDIVDIYGSGPPRCVGEGSPVHLGLIACPRNHGGNIIISKDCPRIMRIEAALMAFGGEWKVEDIDVSPVPPGATYPAAYLDADHSHRHYQLYWRDQITPPPASGIAGINSDWSCEWPPEPQGRVDINDDGRLESNVLGGWDETNITNQYLWLLTIIGPVITSRPGNPTLFEMRQMSSTYGSPHIGNTRVYRYDPSIHINPPPFFPMPEHSLEMLEWSNSVAEIPS